MAGGRPSEVSYLKGEFFRHYAAGLRPYQVRRLHPEVSKSTAKLWFDKYQAAYPNGVITPLGECRTPEEEFEYTFRQGFDSPSTTNLIVIEGAEQVTDIALARKALRSLIQSKNTPSTVIVQAATGLMRLAQIRHELPRHVLNELEERKISDEQNEINDLPADDLAKTYQDLMREGRSA